MKPLSDLRLRLDFFPDNSAITASPAIVRISEPLTNHPLVKPTVSMQ
jgi:hypothetical protein